jgi:hypothetical protein
LGTKPEQTVSVRKVWTDTDGLFQNPAAGHDFEKAPFKIAALQA